MLQLKNHTPFAANMAVFPNEQGVDTLYLNVKACFQMGQEWTLAEEQVEPQAEDVYWGEPAASSLKYASDFHLGKPATDVIMLGHACAPNQKSVRELDVCLTVGRLKKNVRVFGDRVWRGGRITSPAPFETMPLTYERAFGGTVHDEDGQPKTAEARNPVGLGLWSGERKATEDFALPNLEDPRALIRSVNDRPEPACFGFRAPNWQPRAGFAGTYDNQWQRERAPYLPLDYDRRFANGAHPDLIADGFLRGGEAVEITNMHPRGRLGFTLPLVRLAARVGKAGASSTPDFNLETVILEPNQLQLAMVWKASVPCGKRTADLEQVLVTLSR